MLELLSPAGSPESVIAAVQNGADAIYLGLGNFNARRGAKNFTDEEFEKAVRYCRIRGCKVYLTINTLVNDREIEEATRCARFASKCGVSGIIIQDIGLISVLKKAVPDMPLHGSTQMSIHNLAGAEAAAQMGLSRVVLARELNLEQIRFITQNTKIETEVFVHGALCFCHSGQCYLSSLIGRRSGNRGLCAQPCRMQYSMGGLAGNYPMSLKDNCLVQYLDELEEAGVACAKIEGRMKRPEYTAIATGIYSRAIKEKAKPTDADMDNLEKAFSRNGFTQGYFLGNKTDMFGVRGEPAEGSEKLFAEARKAYGDKELRRVNIHIYTLVSRNKPIQAIAFDDDGNKAAVTGAVPEDASNRGINEDFIIEQMYKTGGTPYICIENQAKVDEGLYLSASDVNALRRSLINALTEKRGSSVRFTNGAIPAMPKETAVLNDPKYIFQIRTPDQLTEDLAALKPAYIYVPLEIAASGPELLSPFIEHGCIPVAVMPRVITDDQTDDIESKLRAVHDSGIEEVLAGNLGHVYMIRKNGMNVRGDFGLNSFNSYSLSVLNDIGMLSATASFELRLAQIRDMQKTIPTEAIVYGRIPVMVSDQCIIKENAGRCACQTQAQLSDRTGSVFPVVKEYGCRNVVYNAHKLFLADKKEDLLACGLWGLRLMFTTESPRECVEVAKVYLGLSDYKPNVLTRGLYYRGVD